MSDTGAPERPSRPATLRSRPDRRPSRKPQRSRTETKRRDKTKSKSEGRVTRGLRRFAAALATPRGAALAIALVALCAGVALLGVALTTGPGGARIDFDTASGSAGEIREATLASVRDGDISESLAPGVSADAASRLAEAPIYYLSVFAHADAESPGVLEEFAVAQRVAFVNTTGKPVGEVAFSTAGLGAESKIEDLRTGRDGSSVRQSDSEITVTLDDELKAGGQAVIDFEYRFVPTRLIESNDISDVISGGDTTTSAQLTRRNLAYLIDWYPRIRLGDKPAAPAIASLDIDLPAGWTTASGGTRIVKSEDAARKRERYVLAGSTSMPLVAMLNAADAAVTDGAYRATGIGLDRFAAGIDDSVRQALYAKKFLSGRFESTLWRDNVVIALALRVGSDTVVADNVVLLSQDLLGAAPSAAGPGTKDADYRQLIFEGVAAEWWGGRVRIPVDTLPAYPKGLRAWSAALVWGALGGSSLERLASAQTLAEVYRQARNADTPDQVASAPLSSFTEPGELAIAASKVGLSVPGSAIGISGAQGEAAQLTAVATLGSAALAELNRDVFSTLDPGVVSAAFASAGGVSEPEASAVVKPWLEGLDGDAEIGLEPGEGQIPLYTDASAAAKGVSGTTFPADIATIDGGGDGW